MAARPKPGDELERIADLCARGEATSDDVTIVLLRTEVVYALDDGGELHCEDGCAAVYGPSAQLPPQPPPHCRWERSSGRLLAARTPLDAQLWIDAGRPQARLPAEELVLRAGGDVSGAALVGALERFGNGELTGRELNVAFCATQLYCEAVDEPGFVARSDGSADEFVAVFTSLDELARFAGQTAWFAAIGREILDLLPDGYDVVIDPGAAWAVRLDADALQRRETGAQPERR